MQTISVETPLKTYSFILGTIVIAFFARVTWNIITHAHRSESGTSGHSL